MYALTVVSQLFYHNLNGRKPRLSHDIEKATWPESESESGPEPIPEPESEFEIEPDPDTWTQTDGNMLLYLS